MRLAGNDGVNGVGSGKGQDPPQGTLWHLQLGPGAERHLRLPCSIAALLSSFLKGVCEPFHTPPILLTGLESAKYKLLPDKKFLSADGEFSSVAAIYHAPLTAVENRALTITGKVIVHILYFRTVTFIHVGCRQCFTRWSRPTVFIQTDEWSCSKTTCLLKLQDRIF